MFKDISNFNNTNNYLPILNGVLITELIILILGLLVYKSSPNMKYLIIWYKKFGLSAVICDVLIIIIVIILTRYLYSKFFNSFNIIKFLLLAVAIQVIHDISFYYFFKNVPYGKNSIGDFFKDCFNQNGEGLSIWKSVGNLILSDSGMIISSVLFTSLFANQNLNTNIIMLVIIVYLLPYFYTNTF
jgi:hypothetical protein